MEKRKKIAAIMDILCHEGSQLPEVAVDMVYRILVKFAAKK